MPATVHANDIIQISLIGQMNKQRVMNVLTYKVTSLDEGLTNIKDVCDQVQSIWEGDTDLAFMTKLQTLVSSTAQWDVVRAQVIYPVRTAYWSNSPNKQPLASGNALPQNVAAVITKRSDESGRGKQSDLFIYGLTQAVVAEGQFTAATIAKLNDVGKSISQEITIGENGVLTPIIYGPSGNQTEITYYKSQTECRTMRRRTVRVGE
jgi:hypothetical protein